MSAVVKRFLTGFTFMCVLFLGLFWFLSGHSSLEINMVWGTDFNKSGESQDWFVQFNDGSLGSLEK
jgi:hypothetical protein